MKHPNQTTLALHAGGDLGFIGRWRTERHISRCPQCQEEVAAFSELREIAPELAEIPEIPWNRLAAEMKANIRLGLAAGECVRACETPRESPLFTRARAAVALASVAVLLVAALMLDRPAPLKAEENTILQRTGDGIADGIQVGQGVQAFRLLNAADAQNVTFTVNAQGSMGARYVDPKTGYVTINNVYAE
jgi:hypothetical protein